MAATHLGSVRSRVWAALSAMARQFTPCIYRLQVSQAIWLSVRSHPMVLSSRLARSAFMVLSRLLARSFTLVLSGSKTRSFGLVLSGYVARSSTMRLFA
jgi:hypothetical protein